ncbi:MAG: hypothetical protein E4G91_00625 [Candidatus Zixiibacteriota bacterium]|nr:MAG: hypothetical protein E4G91_00625 [candidate division Zixibacteria bacterium]
MKRFLPLTMALLCALFIAGCIDYEETLELNADGTGTMAMHLAVYIKEIEAIDEMMGSYSEDSTQDTATITLFTREDLEKNLKERKSTVKLLDFKEQRSESTLVYDFKYAFTNLQEMLEISEQMGKNEMMGESGSEPGGEPESAPEITFRKDKSGQWQYARGFQAAEMGGMMPAAEDTTKPESPSLDSAESTDSLVEPLTEVVDTMMAAMGSMMTGMTEMMTKAFADHKMRMTVKFPGTVVQSNATSTNGNTAVWEYKFADFAKAPKQLQATIKP